MVIFFITGLTPNKTWPNPVGMFFSIAGFEIAAAWGGID
jgi:hypothetical protein